MFEAQRAAFPGAQVVDGFYPGCDRVETMAEYAISNMPERASLLGHSMGARVALEIVMRAPERIERLALADTGIHAVREGEQAKRYALRDIGKRNGMAALADEWLAPMVGQAGRDDAGLMDRLRAMVLAAGLDSYERQVEALLHRPDAGAALRSVACPTLVIVGGEDAWSPVAQHREIAAAIAGAQLVVIEGAGHMLPAEAPDAFNRAIGRWLALDSFADV